MALTEEEKRERNNASALAYKKRTGYAADRKSAKKTTKTFLLRYSYSSDQDIIDFLESQENKNDYIRRLIKADMTGTGAATQTRIIPLFGAAFAAGVGEPDFGNALESYEVPAYTQADFAVRVNGDSMEPYLPDGSIQLGIKGSPQDGDVVAIMVDGEFYIKQFCVDAFSNIHLFSLNRARRDLDRDIWASGENRVLCFGTIKMRERIPLPLD